MNFYQQIGPLVFGTRLKRLSDYFLSEVNKVYFDNGIPFEASWFSVFYILDTHTSVSIHEIAGKLEVSHSAISQIIKNLEEKNLVALYPSLDDARKKLIYLSDNGKELLKTIKPIWLALDQVMADLLIENDVLKNLLEIETSFSKFPLNQRINKQIYV